MDDEVAAYQAKAEESLAGAEAEFAGGRYNNCANRAYYACFQAAVAALIRAGIRPTAGDGEGGHKIVQGQFVGLLINRRKLYPADLRDALSQTLTIRERADYRPLQVGGAQARRALDRARRFVAAVGRSRG